MSAMALLEINGLRVAVDGQEILRGLELAVGAGEVHAIMGPNGAGKSTLSHVLSGRDGYEITGGTIRFMGQDLTALAPEERASAGVFLAFQYPIEIPGVSTMTFLRTALNAQRRANKLSEIEAGPFLKHVRAKAASLKIGEDMLKRALNVGFSGGEKKRLEMLQMALFEPKLAILDETDSGLDIDALKLVADGVNAMRGAERAFLVITHYQRLLNHIVPDHVHVLAGGRIIRSGGKELAHELEAHGYARILKEAA